MAPMGATSTRAHLPPEVVDLIIDELRHDKSSLSSCSRVCKSWLPRSSVHLFCSFHISCIPEAHSEFLSFVPSSTRVSSNIRQLEADLIPASAATVTPLLEHLTQLESLSLIGLGLFRDKCDYQLPLVLPTNRILKRLRVAWLPTDVVSYFLDLFVSVDTLDIRFGERAVRSFRQFSHTVKNLDIKLGTDDALLDIGSLADPTTLESIKLDLGGTHYFQVSADRVGRFLQSTALHIKHLEYAQPMGGWVICPSSK